ncbi:MAG TPA: glycosyltransferase [Prolixibacteraceae bacterium]|nr:glycosyltransferase [Prolixibacteraceae bacterium]
MKLINFQLLTITDMVLLALFSLVLIIQFYYLLGRYLQLALHKDRPSNTEPSPVTIILSLRNEEERIRELMTRFTEMDYPDYQVVVVNEFSEDNTLDILHVLAESNPRIKVTSLSQETRFLEKQAINLALKGARSPWIVQLTPDTHTISPEWLTKLTTLTDRSTDAVIGYTNVEKTKGLCNLLCRIERFSQFMVSGSWTLAGSPFVFSENNVLFKKSMYFDTPGFRMKLNRHFANLELIFNENFRNGKVKISLDPQLSVHEKVEDDRGDHIKLIKKSVQIRQSLSWSIKASLFMDDLTKILVTGLAATLIILHPEYWITFTVLLFIYYILLLIIVKKLINRLKERKIFVSSFIYILIKPIINWWFFWSTYLIHHRNKWN